MSCIRLIGDAAVEFGSVSGDPCKTYHVGRRPSRLVDSANVPGGQTTAHTPRTVVIAVNHPFTNPVVPRHNQWTPSFP